MTFSAPIDTTRRLARASGPPWRGPLTLAFCVVMSAELCLALTRQTDHVAAIWLPNAFVLATLMRRPIRDWPWLLVAAFLGNVSANLIAGDSFAIAFGLPSCNALEVLTCAVPLRFFVDGSAADGSAADLARARPLSAFLVLTLGPAPLISGLLAATLLAKVNDDGFGLVLRHWHAAHAVGLLTLTPLLVGLDARVVGSFFRPKELAKTCGLLALMAATLAVVFCQSTYPLLFLTFPPLMLMNFKLGFSGVVIALAMTVIAATAATVEGTGPLSLVHGEIRDQVFVLQGFIAVAGLTSLQLAAVLAARSRLEHQLRQANEDAAIEIAARKVSETAAEDARRDAEEAREHALSANQAKSDFLAAMSHEIRTPLGSIIGFTGLMLDNAALSGELRQQTQIVAAAGTALLTVIDDILDVSKIEAGKVEIERVPFAPHALLNNVVEIIRGIATPKGLDVFVTIDPDLPDVVTGDAARLQQVLLNLLNNAAKFTSVGSVALDVRLEDTDAAGTWVRFLVIDTGPGVDTSGQARLFQRFSQANASVNRRYGGTGLGLSICKQLVELMGGEIGMFSDEGRGSTFWFTLPLARAQDSRAAAPANLPERSAGRCGHLLLVEDVDVNQLLARTLLEADGHTVDVVESGEAAVAAVQTCRYDAVLMDVQMPGMGGIAATRAIRALPRCIDLPIIAMTANVLADQIRQFREAGMDDHVGKPIDRPDLRRTLARWLAAPEPSGQHPVFDQTKFDNLRGVLGAAKMQEALAMFWRDLETRLCAVGLGEQRDFKQDAHVVTSIAGVLGFTDLAQHCSRIVCWGGDENETARRHVVATLHAKEHAMARLRDLLVGNEAPARAA